jgi:hypothetical protein
VICALQQQLVCYEQLARHAKTQHEYVRTGQTEQLLGVLAARQESLDRIAVLEQSLQQAKGDWPAYLAGLDQADRQQAEELLAKTRELLELIVSGDRDDALVLQQQKLNVGRQLATTQTLQTVNRKYATAAYGRPAPRLDVQR